MLNRCLIGPPTCKYCVPVVERVFEPCPTSRPHLWLRAPSADAVPPRPHNVRSSPCPSHLSRRRSCLSQFSPSAKQQSSPLALRPDAFVIEPPPNSDPLLAWRAAVQTHARYR